MFFLNTSRRLIFSFIRLDVDRGGKKKKMHRSAQADPPPPDTPASHHFLHSSCSNWTAGSSEHVFCDSASAGNKCPSFTVCWLIYNNYTSWCSGEDEPIVWDESIKSPLSGDVSPLGGHDHNQVSVLRNGEGAPGRRAFFPERQTTQTQTCGQTEAEKRAISSQNERLLRNHRPQRSFPSPRSKRLTSDPW